jgi:hypothetical protein
MSRSRHPQLSAGARRWARRQRKSRVQEDRALRNRTHQVLRVESLAGRFEEVALEVLADQAEEAGHLERAERLRRGREAPAYR